ncbi:MAG: putative ABC transporter permease [Bacillota bacterium]|nr:putative ABC transporter permease [Bacillota bacterium]
MLVHLFHLLEIHHFGRLGIAALVFYFTVYSFCGWILENSYSFFTGNGFFKPIFLRGPFKPMYGFAPVLLIMLIGQKTNGLIVVLLCFVIPTLVEYMSGALLYKFFQRKWWDYSDMPLQIHGHICLPFSLCWVLLSFICLKWIHPVIASLYILIESAWIWIYPLVIFYFLADLLWTIRKQPTHAVTEPKST